MGNNGHEEKLLKKLAIAILDNPRSNTTVLSGAVGISRATFNRFCGSRENLMEMIAKQTELSMQEIVKLAQEDVKDYAERLSALIEIHFEHEEYLAFACAEQNNLGDIYWERYLNALDKFFLSGQKANVFRLDFSSQMLTELFIAMISGIIDAKHRDRVAASGITKQLTVFFLNGAMEQ